jgi:hypothetical protein
MLVGLRLVLAIFLIMLLLLFLVLFLLWIVLVIVLILDRRELDRREVDGVGIDYYKLLGADRGADGPCCKGQMRRAAHRDILGCCTGCSW